jgi:hypothetical protein
MHRESLKHALGRLRRALPSRRFPPLDPELSRKERIFRIPPLTPQIVDAVSQIAPQFQLRCDERSRDYWERDQNGACWGEYGAVGPILEKLPTPQRVLEVGPGMGRSTVFFTKKLGWQSARFDLYDSDGTETKYTMLGPRFDDSFCGNLALLRLHLEYNGIDNTQIIDARSIDCRLSNLPGPYDLVYAFYSIGFHWSLEHFLDEILSLMHEESLAFFTIPERFEPFPALEEIPHRIVRWKAAWPRDAHHRILLLSKGDLPGVGHETS